MKYFFSKARFSSQFFYKSIYLGQVDVYLDFFHVKVVPYMLFTGYYYKESIIFQNTEKIIHRTLFSQAINEKIDLENIYKLNEFFIEIMNDGSKITIYQSTKDQLILKT